MFALKVVFLSLTVVSICANPTSDNLNQSPSSTEKLPSNPKQETEVKPAIEIIPIQQKSHDETVKPHRLSKRFIPSFLIPSKYNNDLGYPFKRSGSLSTRDAWPVDGRFPPLLKNGYSGYRLNDRDFIKSYEPEVLNYVLGLSKPKRFFGLLPAKEPRRKDLPPRLGEESAPRFARAFNPNPIENPRPPPVIVTLRDLLRHYKTSRYQDPLDIPESRFLAQNFRIDNPVNINNLKLDVEAEEDLFSAFGSDYSANDNVDYSETIEEESSDDDQQTATDDKHQPLSRKEEFEKFKTFMSLVVAQLKDLNRL